MSDLEQIFSARQVAERLGLSAAMVRRYGAALEEITGQPIRQHARDGRQYSAEQMNVLIRAKGFVEANARLSVSQALQLALGEPPSVATPAVAEGTGTASQALSEALERTLLPELRALREEVSGLRLELEKQRAVRPAAIPSAPSVLRPREFDGGPVAETTPEAPREARADDLERGGGLVRLARRLELMIQSLRK